MERNVELINYFSPLWMQVLYYGDGNGNEYAVNCFCFQYKQPLVLTNNVSNIIYNGKRVNIDFRKKFWKSVSLDSNERAVK